MRDHNSDVEEVPSIELTDEELSMVSGGKPLVLDGVEGESKDQSHINEIQIWK